MSKYSVYTQYRTIFWLKQKHFNLLHLPHIYRYFLHQNIFNDWYLAETHLCALQACVGYWALSLSSFRDCSSQIGGRFFDMNKHCVHCLKAESADFFKIGGGSSKLKKADVKYVFVRDGDNSWTMTSRGHFFQNGRILVDIFWGWILVDTFDDFLWTFFVQENSSLWVNFRRNTLIEF